ncbi:hypothetical protein JD844_009375 [Phrynosoma platyrhinos]|uniref:Very-long-chain (3R)-3-hydroxyacyl-CoA dehydratase n=1 Tax=Phrynosoma platyrhinos TaxID=52577 RepID=A0ABQ7TFE5_PHRPL|nr:hypothetical protein JD844_009375 [Phrynosoma platyrhinos]
MNTYIFSYYLIQFCGHSWIFTNMIIRFLSFGEDSVADTFYSIGLVMRICQLATILELLHIGLGIDEDHFLPRLLQGTAVIGTAAEPQNSEPGGTFFINGLKLSDSNVLAAPELALQLVHRRKRDCQITERIIILFVVIASQEEVQGKYIVCILFFLWNFMDLFRYTYCMLAATGIYFQELTWLHYSLWIPLYPLSVLAQAFAIYESLPHFETDGTYSVQLPLPFDVSVYFPYMLKLYMAILFGGTYFIIHYLYMKRKACLGSYNVKAKRS